MNVIFSLFCILGCIVLGILQPEKVLSTFISGGEKGLEFTFQLFCIYSLWLSILKLWENLNFDKYLGRFLLPISKKFFPNENNQCYNYLSINLSANMLGMGGAGTPAGISAIENMQHKKNKIMLVVINSTSIQLIPTTILAMRATHNAKLDIILPSLLATIVSTAVGVILVKFLVK